MAGWMGTVILGSLVTRIGTPRLQVWAPPVMAFADAVDFLWRDTSFREQFRSPAVLTNVFVARPSVTWFVTVLALCVSRGDALSSRETIEVNKADRCTSSKVTERPAGSATAPAAASFDH